MVEVERMKGKQTVARITQSKFFKGIASFANDFGRKSVAANSASIAFFVFISIIPMFILLCSQLPMTGISKTDLTAAVNQLIPPTVAELITSIISEAYNSRIGVFSFSIVVLLWSSSRGVVALVRSLDIVYDEHDNRSVIDLYMFSIFYTVCLLVGASLLLVLYTQELTAEELIKSAMQSDKIYETLAPRIKKMYIISGGILLTALIYKVAPAGKRSFLHQLPGAIFSSVSISLFSVYFAAYTSGSNIYSSFYGSLTTVSLFLIWIYSCINLFLLGGVINTYFKTHIARVRNKLRRRILSRRKAKRDRRHERKLARKLVQQENDNNE